MNNSSYFSGLLLITESAVTLMRLPWLNEGVIDIWWPTFCILWCKTNSLNETATDNSIFLKKPLLLIPENKSRKFYGYVVLNIFMYSAFTYLLTEKIITHSFEAEFWIFTLNVQHAAQSFNQSWYREKETGNLSPLCLSLPRCING